MTKIPSVEEAIEQIGIATYGGRSFEPTGMYREKLTKILNTQRTALLTELREWAISKLEETHVEEDGVPVDTYGYPETHNQPLLELQAHLDELINPTK